MADETLPSRLPGFNSYMVCGTRFDIDNKYTLVKPIGQGAYGVVCSARDNETGEVVAIKKLTKIFSHTVDCKRTLREIKLLRHFHHENVVHIIDILKPHTSKEDCQDLYIVFELMDTDLHQITTSPQPLTDEHCQYFVYQILRGMNYIHSANVIHRDLKPGNLLLNANCDLKVADFGLARTAQVDNHAGFMTEYVATRWYRAPEIMLSWKEYTKAIDVWSVGCIFAELIGRKPLFPGRDYVQQINLICSILGTPSEEDTRYIESDRAKRYIQSLPARPKISFQAIYPEASEMAIDLLEKMLVFDPTKRISVSQALSHPYFAHLHDPDDEPTADPIPFDFEFENQSYSKEQLRDMIFQEIAHFHPEILHEQAGAGPSTVLAPSHTVQEMKMSDASLEDDDGMDVDAK